MTADSEVKGTWFVCMRAWLLEHAPEPTLGAIRGALCPEHRAAFDDPLISAWYPEAMLRDALSAAFVHACDSDEDRFLTMIEGATEIGVSRFFRLLLRLSSVAFVAKLVPTMWRQIRRGRGEVEVDVDGDAATIRYRDFPPLSERLYQDMTVGSLRALLRIATGGEPDVRIVAQRPDGVDVVVRAR